MSKNSLNYQLSKILKNSLIFTIILYCLHKYFQHFFFKDVELYHPIYTIYLFLFLSLVGLFYFIIKAAIEKPDTIFTTFAVGSLMKSAIAVLFFLPLFFKETPNLDYTVFNFFIPYFLFLFFEIYLIIKLFKRLK
ncbi:MAG: hypothetical protein COA67_03115 [Lutibacter sp.]|nr:MAG: hypothetical protein COA67_03115 [Lutibacter sp.]